jgi:hypothetical protein
MTETRKTAEISDAWRELHAIAVAMRADWDSDETRDAILAAKNAGWTYGDAARETWRLVWDADGCPAELRNSARRHGTRPVIGRGDYGHGAALARELLGLAEDPGAA